MGEKALGRRRIGRRLLGRVPKVVPYNHHAVDADRDGIIQEGTIWERPAGMSFNVPHGSRRRPLGAEPISRATRPPKPEVARSRRPPAGEPQLEGERLVPRGYEDYADDPLFVEYVEYAKRVLSAEKNLHSLDDGQRVSTTLGWSAEAVALEAARPFDWEAFSRARGYTEEEIEDFRHYRELGKRLHQAYSDDLDFQRGLAFGDVTAAIWREMPESRRSGPESVFAESRRFVASPDRKAERRRLVASIEAEIEQENVDLKLVADEFEGLKSGVIETIFRKYAKQNNEGARYGAHVLPADKSPSKMRRAVREEVDRLFETFDGIVLYGPPGTSETYAPSRWSEILDAEEIEAELSDFVEEYNVTHLFPLLTQYDAIQRVFAIPSSDRLLLLLEHRKRGELAERGAKRLTDLEASLVLAHKASDEELVALLEQQRRKDVFRVADQIVEPLGDSPLDGNAYVEERREEWLPLSEFKKVLRSRGYWPDPGYDFDLVDRDRAGDEDLQAIYMDLFEAIRLKMTHLGSPQLSHTMRRLDRIAQKANPDRWAIDPDEQREALPYEVNPSSINLFEDFKLLGAIQEEMEFRGLPIHVSPADTLPVGHEIYGRRLWSEEMSRPQTLKERDPGPRVAVSDRRDSESQTLLGVARQALEQRRFENNLYILGRGIIGDIKDADDPRKKNIYDGLGVSGRLTGFVDGLHDRGSIKEESAKSVVNLMSDEQVDRIFEQLQRVSLGRTAESMWVEPALRASLGSDILVGVYGKRAQERAEKLHRQRIDAQEDGEQLDLGQGDKRNLVIGFIEGLHDSWAESAGDHHTRPLAVQLAAARMAGLSDEETAKRVFYFASADDHAKARLTADRVLAAIRAIDPDEKQPFVDALDREGDFPRTMIDALASAVGGIDANSQESSRAESLEALIRTVAKQKWSKWAPDDAAALLTIADYLDNPDPLMNTSDDAKFRKKREVFSMVSAMLNDGLFGDAHDEALPMMTEIAQRVVREAAQGKGTVRLYRGVAFHNTDPYADVSGPLTMDINASPLSSWSLDRSTAEQFAGRVLGEGGSYVIATDVPIEDIVGISVAGFGCIGEAECIVLGKDRQVEILKATPGHGDFDG